jgi:acyl-coenzyme A thioesterase PaaI-like protein
MLERASHPPHPGAARGRYTCGMDMTAAAAGLLEDIPAHRMFGLRVLRAADACGEVGLVVQPAMTNVIGSLHSSGLVALVDATGLAAIIGAAAGAAELEGLSPLGTVAELEFVAPAHGDLVGRCALDGEARGRVRAVLEGRVRKADLITDIDVLDATGATVCHGSFTWRLRRTR